MARTAAAAAGTAADAVTFSAIDAVMALPPLREARATKQSGPILAAADCFTPRHWARIRTPRRLAMKAAISGVFMTVLLG
jgi:hypothetical protein